MNLQLPISSAAGVGSSIFRLMTIPRLLLAPLVSTFLVSPVLAVSDKNIVVAEKFADGDYHDQNPPTSLEWFPLAKSASLEASPGKLSLVDASNVIRLAAAHFALPGDGIEPGQAIVLTFDFTSQEDIYPGFNALRFGLFDSQGERENRFTEGAGNSAAVSSEGYGVFLGIQDNGTSVMTITERRGAGRLMTRNEAFTTIAEDRFPSQLQAKDTYTAQLHIEYLDESQAIISATIRDQAQGIVPMTLKCTISAERPLSFDTVAIAASGGISQLDVANVTIAVVPGN